MTPESPPPLDVLRRFAPGTTLRDGAELIFRQATGVLMVVGSSSQVDDLCTGGFRFADVPVTAQRIAELAKMDGAFIISGDGYALSAARYIETVARFVDLPLGLGSRHMAAASISKETDAVAVVVSESDGVVRVFDDGELVAEIIPRIEDLERLKPFIRGDYETITDTDSNLTVVVKKT